MDSIMFSLFVVLSGYSLGVSLFAIPVRYILWKKTRRRAQVWQQVLMAGVALLVGLFLFLVIPNREAHHIPATSSTWAYLAALALIGTGSLGLASQAIQDLLDVEVTETHDERHGQTGPVDLRDGLRGDGADAGAGGPGGP